MIEENNNNEKGENIDEQNKIKLDFPNNNIENLNKTNEKNISDIKIKKIIQIKDKEEKNNLQLNNNDKNSNTEIKINLNINSEKNASLNKANKKYKKSYPKLKEYFNHDYNNYDLGIYNKFPKRYEQYFINRMNFNKNMNDINYINNNSNIPNPNYPNIITNNNNYYYSILDDFPIHVPLYFNNSLKVNPKPNYKLYNINTTPTNLSNYNYLKNNFYNEEIYHHINNFNSIQTPQIRQNKF